MGLWRRARKNNAVHKQHPAFIFAFRIIPAIVIVINRRREPRENRTLRVRTYTNKSYVYVYVYIHVMQFETDFFFFTFVRSVVRDVPETDASLNNVRGILSLGIRETSGHHVFENEQTKK